MVLDTAGHHLFVFLQGAESGFLICAHKAAVALNIRTEDGRELTLEFFCGHGAVLTSTLPRARHLSSDHDQLYF